MALEAHRAHARTTAAHSTLRNLSHCRRRHSSVCTSTQSRSDWTEAPAFVRAGKKAGTRNAPTVCAGHAVWRLGFRLRPFPPERAVLRHRLVRRPRLPDHMFEPPGHPRTGDGQEEPHNQKGRFVDCCGAEKRPRRGEGRGRHGDGKRQAETGWRGFVRAHGTYRTVQGESKWQIT